MGVHQHTLPVPQPQGVCVWGGVHSHQVAALDRTSQLTLVHKGLLWFCLQLLGPTCWWLPRRRVPRSRSVGLEQTLRLNEGVFSRKRRGLVHALSLGCLGVWPGEELPAAPPL